MATFGESLKRIIKKIIIALLIIGVLVLAFLYWGTYEDGFMSGKIIRISQKGVVFKTYEGKINIETLGAIKGTTPFAESYDFSVDGGDEALIKQLQEVALSGEHVNLHYIKRYVRFPWRGDTKVFAVRVERLGN